MNVIVCAVLLAAAVLAAHGKISPPKVQVYSRNPGKLDDNAPNTLICHVSGFHPPDITITLLKNGKEIEGAKQTDLAFESGWQFHLTKHVPFSPKKGETYSCHVRHMEKGNDYHWEPDM